MKFDKLQIFSSKMATAQRQQQQQVGENTGHTVNVKKLVSSLSLKGKIVIVDSLSVRDDHDDDGCQIGMEFHVFYVFGVFFSLFYLLHDN